MYNYIKFLDKLFLLTITVSDYENEAKDEIIIDAINAKRYLKQFYRGKYSQRKKKEPKMNLIDYFEIEGDASLISWSHGVNSREKLSQALKSNKIF
jgi:hypothetical protein